MSLFFLLRLCFSSEIDDDDQLPPPYSSHSSENHLSTGFDIKVSSPVGTPIYDQMMRREWNGGALIQTGNVLYCTKERWLAGLNDFRSLAQERRA